MIDLNKQCPVCHSPSVNNEENNGSKTYLIDCTRCGIFFITERAFTKCSKIFNCRAI